ncbi:MAG: DUF1294 domain-containing protein [Finegoldia magna]|uniref:DUF1294 domain-containing protein n=1 Tax=Finegoldia magna TaxID=1260 RepID=UPI0026ECA7E5|nr:DUF1294 domain-containing protein [Finegoldia magna]MBS5777182.1 DUF1294 domain-containing protein [Finegoldia magna]MDU1831928.1 DUF1294 domain-containing protein [Finegoldia magna]MDU1879440.1 DUF1294 domain-containing protein [Finegoldia magna]MDU2575906.1 DUF1294 domain-containing protein [Finegoldia magna]MDU7479719.1 DUF1294 domain-containing protein [Finegoldia magna]
MFSIYFLIINLITFLAFLIDKRKAVHNKYRISENILIFLCIIGGFIGALNSMVIFKHKLYKKKFTINIPLISLIYLVAFVLISRGIFSLNLVSWQ